MSKEESLAVGGQAVIEGVMMRNKGVIATCIRNPKGDIITKKETYNSLSKKIPFFGLPFIRGMVNLIEILILGMKTMIWSSNQQLEEEDHFSKKELFFTILFSLVFSIAIFKLLPLLFAEGASRQLASNNRFVYNLLDGAAKILLLLLYLWLISRMKDIQTLFQYHGAEHKTINCYEHKQALTVKNVAKQPRFHPRCGTSFILFVLVISIIFYMLIPLETSFWMKLLIRVLFMPLIAGVSYELIKLAGTHHDKAIMKPIIWPGLTLQKITTKEPNKQQIQVAIKSLKSVL